MDFGRSNSGVGFGCTGLLGCNDTAVGIHPCTHWVHFTGTFHSLLCAYRLQVCVGGRISGGLAKAWGGEVPASWNQGELDFADQIIQLSRITLHKNAHFKVAAWITLLVLGCGLFAVMIWLLHRRQIAVEMVATSNEEDNSMQIAERNE